jgi:hypothetical protein
MLTGRIENPSLSERESGFRAITEAPLGSASFPSTTYAPTPREESTQRRLQRRGVAGNDVPHTKENTMAPIAELSLEQIDSLFGLDNAPAIKADSHGSLLLTAARDKAAADE